MYTRNSKEGKNLSLKILFMIGVLLIVQLCFCMSYKTFAADKSMKTEITSVLLNRKSTSATIQWKENSQASGYAIYMSTDEDGKYEKVKVISDYNNTSYEVDGLDSKETYYFKIRCFELIDGQRIYSDVYSKPKSNTGLLAKITLNSPMSGKNRNYNLKLASSKIRGTILNPGDTFNWFKVVGRASRAKGYKKAGIFVGRKTVKGYGGGVCQVSSTLYQASKKAKLKIVERHKHSQSVPYAKKR